MVISIFDCFSIGLGPSSSHTMGPMRAACQFSAELKSEQTLGKVNRMQVELYGSLACTGIGHAADKALLMGLAGNQPESIDPNTIDDQFNAIQTSHQLTLAGVHPIKFDIKNDLILHQDKTLPYHSNGMKFSAFDERGKLLLETVYYSIGGGAIITENDIDKPMEQEATHTYPFENAAELFALCKQHNLSIAELMLANECCYSDEATVKNKLLDIVSIMEECISNGCNTRGELPGGLAVKRRAPELYQRLQQQPKTATHQCVINWVNLFAIAVNEVNAAGGRVVTAPTNGAAGIIPAVLSYYKHFCEHPSEENIIDFLLTAGAIAILYKKGASISGAEVGCQGEVGVAASMSAGALTAILGGNIDQIENAAEIAMEHHLGMTCDPVAGLVQIPCIERNAIGANKAINAAHLALMETGKNKVSLDEVIATMYETGKDMMTKYKETAQGGLAVNLTEC